MTLLLRTGAVLLVVTVWLGGVACLKRPDTISTRMKVPSITFKGPNGFNYTSRVQDTTLSPR